MRAAASRTFCTAGSSSPMRMAMMAITTSSSISVNPLGRFWFDGRYMMDSSRKGKERGTDKVDSRVYVSLEIERFQLVGPALDGYRKLGVIHIGVRPMEDVGGLLIGAAGSSACRPSC